MSTRAEIRAALKRQGPMSVTEITDHCTGVDRQQVASLIAVLRTEGKIKGYGYDADNKPVYTIDYWPEGQDEPAASAEPAKQQEPAPVETTPSPAPAAVHHEEEVMAEKKPLAERVVEALKEHGNLSIPDLAKCAGTTPATLYTLMGTFVKKHGVVKLSRGVYGLGTARTSPPPNRKDGEVSQGQEEEGGDPTRPVRSAGASGRPRPATERRRPALRHQRARRARHRRRRAEGQARAGGLREAARLHRAHEADLGRR